MISFKSTAYQPSQSAWQIFDGQPQRKRKIIFVRNLAHQLERRFKFIPPRGPRCLSSAMISPSEGTPYHALICSWMFSHSFPSIELTCYLLTTVAYVYYYMVLYMIMTRKVKLEDSNFLSNKPCLELYNFVERREWRPLPWGPPWWAQYIYYGPDVLNMAEVPVVGVWFASLYEVTGL